jgi:aryl-alcohol dehydrogenase-like predicted oxidoreductase
VLKELGLALKPGFPESRASQLVHVATKVRLFPGDLADVRSAVFRSVEASLQRLQLPAVTLLQLHNSLTAVRGAQATSLTPEDVLGAQGILAAFAELQRAGLVQHLGLTGLGEPAALIEVIRSRQFATVQAPFNVLHPSAGYDLAEDPPEHDLRGLFAACREFGLGVFAIRVYAGGALVGLPPSAHTLTTKFFPLDLYERDRVRAAALQGTLAPNLSVPEVAFRFALGHPAVSSALVGCGTVTDVEQAVAFAERGPLPTEQLDAWKIACGFAPVE